MVHLVYMMTENMLYTSVLIQMLKYLLQRLSAVET